MSSNVLRIAALLLVLGALAFVFRDRLAGLFGPRVESLAEDLAVGKVLGADEERDLMIRVQSSPRGARVLIDGEDRGSTPAVSNIRCRTGEASRVEVRKPGYESWTTSVTCAGEGIDLEASLIRESVE